MNPEQPKKKPLLKISEDFKKGLGKFQEDVQKFFKVPVPKKSEEISPEDSISKNVPQHQSPTTTNATPTAFQGEIQEKWDQFLSKSQSDLKTMEESWHQSIDQFKEKNEDRRQERITRRKNRRKQQREDLVKVQTFFQTQNKQIESTFQTIEKNMRERKVQNREKSFENLEKMQKKWDVVMNKQQKSIESSLSSVNSFGWKQSMKGLLIIIPILVILIIIFSMIKPYLTFLI